MRCFLNRELSRLTHDVTMRGLLVSSSKARYRDPRTLFVCLTRHNTPPPSYWATWEHACHTHAEWRSRRAWSATSSMIGGATSSWMRLGCTTSDTALP